jgi:hypothetical protein
MRIYGPVVEQEIRQITTKEVLRELCKDIDIITDTKRKDWDGLGILEKWIVKGYLIKYLRVKRRVGEE